jgi:DNA-binding NtrC family response regulator
VRLDTEDGTAILPLIKQFQPTCLAIFITGFGSMDSAVKAIQEGAFDYISKPLDLADIESDLRSVVSRALKHQEVLFQSFPPVMQVNESTLERTMVGRSEAMMVVYGALARAAMTRENVLILGESGTGKELVARAIHSKSRWAKQPFITVNCCALSENLLESELFGHVRGAFTGALHNKAGLFEEANGGTLFLDEIGDVSPALQVKLLRAIQEGEIKAVGSNETRKVDVRVVTATHRNLVQFVQEEKFREDLFYRLKVISIEMPPLRERMRDLPELVQYFASRCYSRVEKKISGVSAEALEVLTSYSWPGNVRELENAIGRAVAMARSSVLFPEDFPPEILEAVQNTSAPETADRKPVPVLPASPLILGESLEELERRHITQTLQSVNFNKSKAADILGIDRVTLYRKAFKYGLISKGIRREADSNS